MLNEREKRYTIYFLHGFESSLPSSKVDVMNELGFDCVGFPMNYDLQNPYKKLYSLIEKDPPSMIVGSSMGGYFALHIGTTFNIPLILLNPALINRSVSFDEPIEYGPFRPKIWALLGELDEIIPSSLNKLELDKFGAFVEIWGHGHRTPKSTFQQYITFIKDDILQCIQLS